MKTQRNLYPKLKVKKLKGVEPKKLQSIINGPSNWSDNTVFNTKESYFKIDNILITRLLNLLVVILLFTNSSYSHSIKGKVYNSQKQEIAFANVFIKSESDSIKIVGGVITDIKGNYKIKNITNGTYKLYVSYIGYETRVDTVVINGADLNHDIIIRQSAIDVQEIEVTANTIKREINKKTMTITKLMRKKSYSSLDILKEFPDLNVDMLNNKISSNKNGSIKVLLNGISSNEIELLSISSDEIDKIEYYDIIPARYANSNYGGAINIITKKKINGLSILADAKNAGTTGFSDNMININYINKNTKLTLNYHVSYRNYNEQVINDEIHYSIGSDKYINKKIGKNSKMNYTIHNINLKFLNRRENDYVFQIELKPYILKTESNILQDLDYQKNNSKQIGSSIKNNKSNIFQPKFDLYFEKQLKNGKKVIFDIFYSYNKSDYNYSLNEHNQDLVLFDININNKNIKHSIILESIFSSPSKIGAFNIGSKYYYGKVYHNNNAENETSENMQLDLYSDYTKKFKQFSIYSNLGISLSRYDDNKNSFNKLLIKPTLALSYAFSKISNIRLKASQYPVIPTLSQLSNFNIPLNKDINFTGNNTLKPYNVKRIDLNYTLNLGEININPSLKYNYSNEPYHLIYKKDKNSILKTYETGDFSDMISFSLMLTFKPFKKRYIDFQFMSVFYKQRDKYENFTNGNTDYTIGGKITGYYGNFSVSTYYQTACKMLNGQYLTSNGRRSYIELNYKNKDLLIGLAMSNPYTKTWNRAKETTDSSIVQEYKQNSIYDNSNMLSLHLRYNFSTGDKIFNIFKRINNNDSDNGIIKTN